MTTARQKPIEAPVDGLASGTEPVLYRYLPGDRIWCSVRRRYVAAEGYVPLDDPRKRPQRSEAEDAEPLTEKKCTRCEVIRPLQAFYAREKGRGGVSARCKECLQLDSWKRYRTPEGKAAMQAASARYRASELGKATRAAKPRRTALSPADVEALRDKLTRLFGSV